MPRDGSGVYDVPPGTAGTPNTTILSAAYNAFLADLIADLNAARPVTAGGTGGTSVITGWDGLAKKGTDIATASSINLTTATGPSLTLTGTTTVTGVTLAEGSIRIVRAAGAFQITASASLLCNGSAVTNLTVAAEDLLVFRGGAASVVSVARIGSASVAAATTTAAGIVELATATEAFTGTDTTRAVTPFGLYFPTGHLSGLTLSNNGSDATNDIDIAAGKARDSTDSYNMVLAAALTKQLDAAWAVGTNAGMRATGVAIANTTYHIFLIRRADTGVVDIAADTSVTGANIAANTDAAYTAVRRIGSIVRVSNAIKAFTQVGDEFRWNVPLLDINTSAQSTTAILYTLTVPIGIKVSPFLDLSINAGSGHSVLFTSPDQTDTAAAVNGLGFTISASTYGDPSPRLLTNTSGQIRARGTTASTNIFGTLHGYVDITRRVA
jgi:hypothetical protein